ncbi:class I SAM-dependent methyltransferase [Aureimonas pseudogalii]|uniref:SAM-dependent methyltransferase n=1 Tax=Aureimonas pseudogalii TaxID=1744844 RepID=A0A7W6MKB7_9HYPH|nr:class I SAM-dependent methyltransferase [Aureimonas pseudogalii]MBB3998890.1 SAM-dependent methyltransferase [Aureimonas pseudogalii]
MSLNPYHDDLGARIAAPQGHRAVIGGLWDEMGARQRDHLLDHGLRPSDFILDIGCGSLRAGVAIVPVVEPGHYYGIDLLEPLLEAGYREEIVAGGLAGRLPRGNLAQSEEFAIPFAGVTFDMALAQSVFTHLPINHLRLCLYRLRPRMRRGGTFFCTFFIAPDTLARDASMRHPPAGEVESFGWRDPFHVWTGDIAFAAEGLDWQIDGIRDWNHPRGQKMVHFIAV